MNVSGVARASWTQNLGRAKIAAKRLEGGNVRMARTDPLAVDDRDVGGDTGIVSGICIVTAAGEFRYAETIPVSDGKKSADQPWVEANNAAGRGPVGAPVGRPTRCRILHVLADGGLVVDSRNMGS